MSTRRKYWLHISSTNQAKPQVNTAVSPQTARNFGLKGECACASPQARRSRPAFPSFGSATPTPPIDASRTSPRRLYRSASARGARSSAHRNTRTLCPNQDGRVRGVDHVRREVVRCPVPRAGRREVVQLVEPLELLGGCLVCDDVLQDRQTRRPPPSLARCLLAPFGAYRVRTAYNIGDDVPFGC